MFAVYAVTTVAVTTAVATLAALPSDRVRRRTTSTAPVAAGNLIAVLLTLAVIALTGLGRGWAGALAAAAGLAAGNLIADQIADRAWGPARAR